MGSKTGNLAQGGENCGVFAVLHLLRLRYPHGTVPQTGTIRCQLGTKVMEPAFRDSNLLLEGRNTTSRVFQQQLGQALQRNKVQQGESIIGRKSVQESVCLRAELQ